MLWCIEKPHSVEAIDVSSHLIKQLGDRESRSYSTRLVNETAVSWFLCTLFQLLILKNAAHLEIWAYSVVYSALPLSGSALDKLKFGHTHVKACCTPTDYFSCCKKDQNVSWGSSPLNLHVLFSCKCLLRPQAWPLSPQTNKYSVKSIDLRVQIASCFQPVSSEPEGR